MRRARARCRAEEKGGGGDDSNEERERERDEEMRGRAPAGLENISRKGPGAVSRRVVAFSEQNRLLDGPRAEETQNRDSARSVRRVPRESRFD